MARPDVILIELPTFPKGVLSLSLSAVAASLPRSIEVQILDMNVDPLESIVSWEGLLFVGIKVSAQNYHIAQEVSAKIQQENKSIKLIWGGEFPTLLPKESLMHCNAVVQGSFEPIVSDMIFDISNDQLELIYDGRGKYKLEDCPIPQVASRYNLSRYYSFMGVPVETSRGCDKKCTFCMVHVMQNTSDLKPAQKLKKELQSYSNLFINVIDYNLGVNEEHLLEVCKVFEQSEISGWMGEMCLESLDDDKILLALQKSRCKIIYCGLESLDELSLKSVNKSKTNVLENYERIIRKAQSYNIQIAAGLILGLEGMTIDSFRNTLSKFSEWGIIYTKMTFLTYNPGTKVKESMRKKGRYLTEEVTAYDGNHLSFVANHVSEKDVFEGSTLFINEFYGLKNIEKRSKHLDSDPLQKMEFILFNLLYREVYLNWLKYDIFKDEDGFNLLLRTRFKKTRKTKKLEYLLKKVRAELLNRSKQ